MTRTLAACAALTLVPAAGQAAEWSDTSLSWRHGNALREPFNPADISKNIFALTHASGYKYGSNFFNLDLLQSDGKGCAPNTTSDPSPARSKFLLGIFQRRQIIFRQVKL